MAERAAHLVDHVFPDVPVRQWVFTVPPRVRYLLAWRHDLCRAPRFHAAPPPTPIDMAEILTTIVPRAPVAASDPVACHTRAEGFDLHAGVPVPAGHRDRLEHLCRYALRPPLGES